MNQDLREIRKQAEEAVRDMPEGTMKVKAFETILSHLLSNSASQKTGSPRRVSKTHQREAAIASPGAPKSCAERLLFLKNERFFESQRSIADIRAELKKNGWHYPVTSLSGPLQVLVQKRQLRRENAQIDDDRRGWKYSNP